MGVQLRRWFVAGSDGAAVDEAQAEDWWQLCFTQTKSNIFQMLHGQFVSQSHHFANSLNPIISPPTIFLLHVDELIEVNGERIYLFFFVRCVGVVVGGERNSVGSVAHSQSFYPDGFGGEPASDFKLKFEWNIKRSVDGDGERFWSRELGVEI